MKPKNIYYCEKIPAKNEDELFETLCRDKNVHIERIISNGQTTQKGKWLKQDHNEWILILQGKATLELENTEAINLEKGDYLLIPAKLKHRVSFTSKNPVCIWLAIHFSDDPEKLNT